MSLPSLPSGAVQLTLCLTLLPALLPGLTLAQEPSFPDTLAPPIARQRFEQAAVEMRDQHCQALRQAANQLATRLKATDLTPEQQQTLSNIIAHWQSASDLPKAIEHAVQLAIQLPAAQRHAIDELSRQLHEQWKPYQALKHQYRQYLEHRLAEAWFDLTLAQKRERVGQLLALDGQSSIWLLAQRPFSSIMPLHATAKFHFDQYASEKRSLLASAYAALVPQVTAITEQALQTSANTADKREGPAAASQLAELLSSTYGSSLRGLMLLDNHRELPPQLRLRVATLMAAVDKSLQELEADNRRLVETLDSNLKALRRELASSYRFVDLLMVDTWRSETARLWRPIRIYARRLSRAEGFEDAYLVARRGESYEIEFLIDGQSKLVARSDVWLNASEARLPQRMRRLIPADGPGQPVTATAPLELEVQCHSPRGWQPAHVIDESPFGVELIWQSTTDPRPMLEPRANLRMVPRS